MRFVLLGVLSFGAFASVGGCGSHGNSTTAAKPGNVAADKLTTASPTAKPAASTPAIKQPTMPTNFKVGSVGF